MVPELGAPPITVAPGQFLLKDGGLLAASFRMFVDSRKAMVRRCAADPHRGKKAARAPEL